MAKKKKAKRKSPAPKKLNGHLRDYVFTQVNKSRAAQGVRISNLVQALKKKRIATTNIAIGKSVASDPRMLSEGGYIRVATGPEQAGKITSVELRLGKKAQEKADREANGGRTPQAKGRAKNIIAAVEVLDIVLDSKDLPAVARQKLLLTTRRLMTGED